VSRPAATEETACNLCGAREYEVVSRVDRDGQPLRTVLCTRCGLVWTNPRPSAADMDRYYEREYRSDYKGAAAPPLRKVVRGLMGAVERWRMLRPVIEDAGVPADASARRRVLDVGCGAGEFVHVLRRAGVEASGIEPGREYAEFARRVLEIPIQTATVGAAQVPPASLDVVTMFHALEHVPDPLGVLRTVRTWLTRGGALVVEVPNVESTVQAPAHRYHYAHLHHFSAGSLRALGEAAGFTHERTWFSPDGGNVMALFRRQDDQERIPAGLERQAARTLAILRGHTTVRHYLRPLPYVRPFQRLRQRWHENRLIRRFRTTEDAVRVLAQP
jgi:2-polyprenyl-3-methyl-5-hydroxy-6-metoxy-1,4-benzoquinol methylase